MAEFTVHPQYLRKLTLKSLDKMENMSKPLVEFTFHLVCEFLSQT